MRANGLDGDALRRGAGMKEQADDDDGTKGRGAFKCFLILIHHDI